MITLYLIRHGETEWNKSGRYQGSTDVALSDMGMAQAEKVASYFKDIPLDGVITGPLQRARITAEELQEVLMPYHILIRKCGNYEGLDETYFRVAVRTEEENRILIEALRAVGKD